MGYILFGNSLLLHAVSLILKTVHQSTEDQYLNLINRCLTYKLTVPIKLVNEINEIKTAEFRPRSERNKRIMTVNYVLFIIHIIRNMF